MANSILGGSGLAGKAYAQEMQNKLMASQAQLVKTSYTPTPTEEVGRYSLELRPRAMVYEVDGGYLVQVVPRSEGARFLSPRFVTTPQEIGAYLLQQQAVEALDR